MTWQPLSGLVGAHVGIPSEMDIQSHNQMTVLTAFENFYSNYRREDIFATLRQRDHQTPYLAIGRTRFQEPIHSKRE